jgi:hypothetical protein
MVRHRPIVVRRAFLPLASLALGLVSVVTRGFPPLGISASASPPTTLLTAIGEQPFWHIEMHRLWERASPKVNVASGDLIFRAADLQLQGTGSRRCRHTERGCCRSGPPQG